MPFSNFGGIPLSQKGAPNGVATLDGAGTIPSSQIGPVVGVSRFHAQFDELGNLYCPSATELRFWDTSTMYPSLTVISNMTPNNSPATEGGVWAFSTGSDRPGAIGGFLFTDVLANQWGVGFDGVLPDPLTGLRAYLGIASTNAAAAGGPHVAICSEYDQSVPAQTLLFLECYDGVDYTRTMLPAPVTGRHWFFLFKDATTIRVVVDGAVVLSSADLSRVPAVPCLAAGYNNQLPAISSLRLSRFAARSML